MSSRLVLLVTVLFVVAIAVPAVLFFSALPLRHPSDNHCGTPCFGLGSAVVRSSTTGTTVSTAWANFTIEVASPGLAIGDLTFVLRNGSGSPVTIAGSSCAPLWTGSGACVEHSLTVAMVDPTGTTLLTYDLGTARWGAPGNSSEGMLLTSMMMASLEVTMTGMGVVVPALSGHGYALAAIVNAGSGGTSISQIP